MSPSLPDLTTPEKPNLYGLLIGVGAYERERPLRGPVGDVQTLTRYLNQLPYFTPNLHVLTDQQASKDAIINAFRQHLTQAGPKDTVLVYFAGHGAQEAADTDLWLTEDDHQLECLVCHDAGATNPWDFLLVDKELRYLIGPVSATGAHIVLIFDCCHSGDNTRGDDLLATALAEQDVRDRRLAKQAPQRPYEAFCFHEQVSADQLKAQGIEVALPQGVYIQMAACESDESAVEVNGEGIFTKNLLAVLEAAHGQVSYQELQNRVRQYMRFGYEQRPRVSIADMPQRQQADPAGQTSLMMSRGFLNQPINPDVLSASATYNNQAGWLLDVGAIHGMVPGIKNSQLHDPTEQVVYSVSAGRIGPDYTALTMADEVLVTLDKTVIYQVTIAGLLTRPIRLHFANHGGPASDLADLLKPIPDSAKPGLTAGIIIPEDDETRADYTLHVRNGLYYITRPNDPDRPLIRPLRADDSQVIRQLTDSLRHVAQWQYLRQLKNPEVNTALLGIELIPQGGAPIQLTSAEGNSVPPMAVPISFSSTTGKWTTTLAIRLTNPTDQPLYCTALYLSRDFMAYKNFLPTNYRLEPGQTVTLGRVDRESPTGRKSTVQLTLEEVIRQYNWHHSTEYVKFLITTDPLTEKTLAFLSLEPLPSPPVLADLLKPSADRGGIDTDEETDPLPGWSTQTITLDLINPLYNTVRLNELSQMLAPPADSAHEDMMTDFALGLYYQLDTAPDGQPTLKLRDELTIIKADEGERGLWGDLTLAVVNAAARRIQNRRYEQNQSRYKDRIRIVAEGDSWFQYPFILRDIIDYLSGVYSVFSVAAAGATLADYLKNSTFTEAISRESPAFFLLSGGGNDLLGKTFPLLIQAATAGDKIGPERYLSPAFATTLADIKGRYHRILDLVQQCTMPPKVIVHGYDYVIPSNADTSLPGKSSWMGEAMTACGITDPGERDTVAHYFIDAFNEQLQQVAAAYPNVSYIDLRGTVRRTNRLADYWYDEIHPNDKGFLSISSKFVARINELSPKRQPASQL